MDDQTLITIGITCYNAEQTIVRAIRSAQEQDWPNFEIIIVDDFSEDNSIALIEDVKSTDPRIKCIQHEENSGFPAALNTIVNNASGEYIVFFDDDDVSVASRLSQQFKRIKEYEERNATHLIFCYSNRDVYIDGVATPSANVYAIGRQSTEPHGDMVADFLLLHTQDEGYCWGQFGSCTLMTRTSVLKELGAFDENFRRSAEWDMAIRLAFKKGHFIAVDRALVYQHKTYTPDKSGRKPLIYALMLRKKYKKFLCRRGVYLSSVLMAYVRFYYVQGYKWKGRIAFLLACCLSPFFILPREVRRRFLQGRV